MKLYCNDIMVGKLNNCHQDPPFIEADILPADRDVFARLVNANIFLNEVVPALGCNCFADPENDTYERELNSLCITEQDIDLILLGRWRLKDGERCEAISLISIEPHGRIRWRPTPSLTP